MLGGSALNRTLLAASAATTCLACSRSACTCGCRCASGGIFDTFSISFCESATLSGGVEGEGRVAFCEILVVPCGGWPLLSSDDAGFSGPEAGLVCVGLPSLAVVCRGGPGSGL